MRRSSLLDLDLTKLVQPSITFDTHKLEQAFNVLQGACEELNSRLGGLEAQMNSEASFTKIITRLEELENFKRQTLETNTNFQKKLIKMEAESVNGTSRLADLAKEFKESGVD